MTTRTPPTATVPSAVPTCSALRRQLGVDTAGSPTPLRSWLLLEHPGAWSDTVRDEVFAAALPAGRHVLLQRLWHDEQLRPLLVRRPGRAGRVPVAEPVLLIGAAQGSRRWLERLPASALPDLDIEAVAAGEPGHGEPVDGPLLAVCTHGAVDRCCAVHGRPLVAALHAVHPGRTWELTHVGGCRFSANLLVLPDGVLHGGTTPEAGLRIAEAALAGRLELTGLRGRTGGSAFAGTAEVALRRHLDLVLLSDVEVLAEHLHPDVVRGRDGPEPAGADVVLRAGADVWRVVVRARELGVTTSICDGPAASTAPVVTAVAAL
jgi:hypothetical protein